MMIFDSDDFGCSHIISDMCQSHDCRDMLLEFKKANPNFKATLFTIPGEMTQELYNWAGENSHWIELAVHGFYHTSNYECEKITYEEFDNQMNDLVGIAYVKGFKAPGWQISDDIYRWLLDHDWWVADQSYNNERRPEKVPTYINDSGQFYAYKGVGYSTFIEQAIHTHTWNCVGNGVYELHDEIIEKIKGVEDFKFISEVV